MKKTIFYVAAVCAFIIMMCGCNKSEDVSSQSVTSDSDTVLFISDNVDTIDIVTDTELPYDITTDDESDSETYLDSSSETDTDTETATTESEEDTQDEENTVSAEEVASSLTGYEDEIAGTWTARYILNDSQNEVDGSIIYGTAYSQYGGELTLNSDGTFYVRMGAGTDDSSTRGTYTYNGGGLLTMQYYNDNTADFERCSLNGEDAIAMTVDLFGDVYTVYFMR